MDADLQWLGGAWDGEGSFSIVHQYRRKLAVQSRFTNCSPRMISEVTRILRHHGVPFHLEQRPPTTGRRQVSHLSCNGMKRTKRLLDVIQPYLRGKAPDAAIVSRFIQSRLAQPNGAPYTPDDLACFRELRDLHGYHLRESSETICSALASAR